MDAYSTDRDSLTSFDPAPVLVAASSEAALARARPTIQACGLRVGAELSIVDASERIERQVSASAIWVELDHDCGDLADELLANVNRHVSEGRYGAVVSVSGSLLDAASAQLIGGLVDLIVDADEAERVAALALASSRSLRRPRLSDVASDHNAERLRQLSDEVSRIASTLARLSSGPSAPRPTVPKATIAEAPPVSAELVRSIIRARRLRARFFQEDLFADPAWDMLLDLFQAEIAQLRVPVSSLCIAAAVPATTASRWLKTMVEQGLFVRRADPHDGRRVFVELAPETSEALRSYFAEVGQFAGI
jgi:DNA-binding MarR family transcriptional regulator